MTRKHPLGSLLISVLVLSMIAIPMASAASQAPPLHFAKPIPYDPGGSNPTTVAVADINGDGRLDLVVAYWGGGVGVLLGNGDGTFQPAIRYDSGGASTSSVVLADVNGDGKPDIVVLNAFNGPGTVGVLRGNGDGTFQPAVTYYTGDYSIPEAIAVGDPNGDGHPDIAVANFGHSDCDCNDGQIGMLWNNGDGTFQPMVFYPSGGYDTVSVSIQQGMMIVINLCQDKYCDWPNGSVCVNGTCYDTGGMDPSSAAVGDLNGDGKPDLVVANLLSNPDHDPSKTLGVFLNDGWFDFPLTDLYSPGGAYPGVVGVADLNGDGKADVVVNTRSGLSVMLGNGDGTLQPPIIFSGGASTIADVNGDGKPDLVALGSVTLNTSGFATTTHVTSSSNPSFVGQPVTFTATATSRYGPIPDGKLVTFYNGTAILGSAALTGGTASFTTTSLSANTHTIKAVYPGDVTLAPSKAGMNQIVQKYPTTAKLTSSPNPSTYGDSVTFTATVTTSGPPVTGKVRFFDWSLPIGSGTLSGGVATITTSKLMTGTHSITAEYAGDASNAKSTSPVHYQKVE